VKKNIANPGPNLLSIVSICGICNNLIGKLK